MKYTILTVKGLNKLAADLINKLGPEQRIFGLIGPLGSGKTTFTKILAHTLGINKVKSPTFGIMHCYKSMGKSLYHIDLYRLNKYEELTAVGIEDALDDKEALVIIEWADKFPQIMKRCDYLIKFEVIGKNSRNVTVTSN